jgi:hypothetical protein
VYESKLRVGLQRENCLLISSAGKVVKLWVKLSLSSLLSNKGTTLLRSLSKAHKSDLIIATKNYICNEDETHIYLLKICCEQSNEPSGSIKSWEVLV